MFRDYKESSAGPKWLVSASTRCTVINIYVGGCQNYGPFLGTLNIRCRIIMRTQKGTLILTTTHVFRFSFLLQLDNGQRGG